MRAELDDARHAMAALEARIEEACVEIARAKAEAASAEHRAADAHAEHRAQLCAVEARGASEAAAIEARIVDLAFAVARKVVGRELATAPDLIVEWAREALAASGLGAARLAVSPGLHDRFARGGWTETPVDLEADLAADTCELRTETRVVEVSAEARVEAVGDHAREAA